MMRPLYPTTGYEQSVQQTRSYKEFRSAPYQNIGFNPVVRLVDPILIMFAYYISNDNVMPGESASGHSISNTISKFTEHELITDDQKRRLNDDEINHDNSVSTRSDSSNNITKNNEQDI
ncbi:unnamed protein product, partial [Medioppia subpectinata]